ncbi:MAG TPA: hypothetical protein VF210_10560 [Pseudomonadales bacterium]
MTPVLGPLALAAALASPAAWPADDVQRLRQALGRCAAIEADDARLGCFDALAASASRPETAPEPAARQVVARLRRVEQRPRGEYVFYLDNGEVWTESSPGRRRYHDGQRVRIERTLTGGFVLTAEDGGSTRVRRLD